MNYIAVFAAGILTGSVCTYVYNNPVKTVSILIDLYVDVKHLIMPPKAQPKPQTATVPPLDVLVRDGYKFTIYTNFTVWQRINEQDPQLDYEEWALDSELQPFRVVRCDKDMFNDDLLRGIQQLAGPAGDFDGRVPTLDILNAYVGTKYEGLLVVENGNHEEFNLRHH